jgi:hypothetical protein
VRSPSRDMGANGRVVGEEERRGDGTGGGGGGEVGELP